MVASLSPRKATRPGSRSVRVAGLCPGEEIRRDETTPQPRSTQPRWPLSPGQRGPVLSADRHAAGPRGRRVPSSALRRSPAAPPPRQVGSHGRLSQPGSAPRRRAPIRRPQELPLGCGRPRQSLADLRRGGSPARPLCGTVHPTAGCTEAGASAGLHCCWGRGRETSCSEPVGPAWRRPASSLRVAVRSAREWGRGRDPKIGVRLSSPPGNRLSPQKPNSWKLNIKVRAGTVISSVECRQL